MPTAKTTKKTTAKSSEKSSKKTETFETEGKDLVKIIKEIIHQGNIRKITIFDKTGKEIVVLPLTISVLGVVIAPPLAVISLIAALVTDCSVKVEKK